MAEPQVTIGIVTTVAGFAKSILGGSKPKFAGGLTEAEVKEIQRQDREARQERRREAGFGEFEGVGLGALQRFVLTNISSAVPEPEAEPPRRAPRDPKNRPSPFPSPRRAPGRGTERRRPRLPRGGGEGRFPGRPGGGIPSIVILVGGEILKRLKGREDEILKKTKERKRQREEDESRRELDKRKQEILEEIERRRVGDPVRRTQAPEPQRQVEIPAPGTELPPVPGRPVPGQPSPQPQTSPRPSQQPGSRPQVPGIGAPRTLEIPFPGPGRFLRPGTAPKISFAPGPSASPPKIEPPAGDPIPPPTLGQPPQLSQAPRARTRTRQRKCEKTKPKRPRKTCRRGFFEETPTRTKFTTWDKIDCATGKRKKGKVTKLERAVEKVARRVPNVRGVIPIALP